MYRPVTPITRKSRCIEEKPTAHTQKCTLHFLLSSCRSFKASKECNTRFPSFCFLTFFFIYFVHFYFCTAGAITEPSYFDAIDSRAGAKYSRTIPTDKTSLLGVTRHLPANWDTLWSVTYSRCRLPANHAYLRACTIDAPSGFEKPVHARNRPVPIRLRARWTSLF